MPCAAKARRSHAGAARDRRAGACAGHERDRLSDGQLVQAAGRGTPRAAPRHVGPAQPGVTGARALLGAGDRLHELELRSPDNMANPYLALAVALASDGRNTRGEEPPLASDENLVRHDDAELIRLGVPSPQTLGDALMALAEDDLVREALGDYVCDQFLLVKRAEWSDYRRYVSPWERERYGE